MIANCLALLVLILPASLFAGEFILSARTIPDPVYEYGVVRARTASALRLDTPPTLDGRLNESLYQQPPVFTNFVTMPEQTSTRCETHAWAGYDPEHLYLGFRCAEPALDKLRIAITQPDDRLIWKDDIIEIFLDPFHTDSGYHQFMINANGTIWDALIRGRYFAAKGPQNFLQGTLSFTLESPELKWNSNAKAVAGREKDAWTLEVAIPWRAFGDSLRGEAGRSFAFSLGRHRIPSEETSNWSILDGVGGNHNPRRFGLLVLGGEVPYVSLVQPPEFTLGLNTLRLTVRNPTANEARITGKLSATGGATTEGESAVSVAAGQDAVLALPYTIRDTSKPASITAEIRYGTNVIFAARYEGSVRQPLTIALPHKDLLNTKKTEVAQVELALSSDVLGTHSLELQLVDAGGNVVRGERMKGSLSRFQEITFATSGLKVGRYTLRGAVVAPDGKPLVSRDAPMNVIPDPLDF